MPPESSRGIGSTEPDQTEHGYKHPHCEEEIVSSNDPTNSLHVYGVPENPNHPLRRTRRDFEAAGLDGRSIRITEWGLGDARTAQARAFIKGELLG